VAAILCACQTATPAAAPHIVFDATEHDFGRVDAGSKLEHVFTFHNAGGRELSVDTVRASCNDSATIEPARQLAAGAVGRLVVAVDSTHIAGPCNHSVTVYANDPAQPVTNLKLTGHVNVDVAATPPQLYVGHLRRGQEARFDVSVAMAQAVRLTEVATRSRIVDVRLDHGDTGTRRVRVAIQHNAPAGRFNESLLIRTTSRVQPELAVPVVGFVDESDR
jgi:hypothetical protein